MAKAKKPKAVFAWAGLVGERIVPQRIFARRSDAERFLWASSNIIRVRIVPVAKKSRKVKP